VQTTERYLGCKQNLGHPVNDLFDLGTDEQPHEKDGESATVKASDDVEKPSRQGIEYRHGGLAMTSPSATQDRYPYQNEPFWSRSEKVIARTAFDAALGRELHEVIQEAKKMAS
jgi:hypothetical protein